MRMAKRERRDGKHLMSSELIKEATEVIAVPGVWRVEEEEVNLKEVGINKARAGHGA